MSVFLAMILARLVMDKKLKIASLVPEMTNNCIKLVEKILPIILGIVI